MFLLPFVAIAASGPSITSQPTNQMTAVGGNATFTVTASGSPTLVYRWTFNGGPLTNSTHHTGVTNTTLTVNSVFTNDAGNYQVIVTNTHGSVTSSIAALTVGYAPAFTTQPQSQNRVIGSTVKFFAAAAGTDPVSYRWYFGGAALTNNSHVSGTAGPILHINNTQLSDAGFYTVVASNFFGSVTSAVVTLSMFTNSSGLVRYVDANNPAPLAPYDSWNNAATNIQDAVDAANPGERIYVTNGIYYYSYTTNVVTVPYPLSLISASGPGQTIIDGIAAMRCLYLANGSSLSGFTITNGSTAFNGGGIQCESTNVTITNCVVAGNSAVLSGGGVSGGTLIRCLLFSNSAAGNTIGYPGGAGAGGSVLDQCVVAKNFTSGYGTGGGLYNCVASHCLITNNATPLSYGGGVSQSTLNNCLLANNHAGSSSGGADGSTLNNCTAVGNVADFGPGGGVNNCTVNNSIVYYNASPYLIAMGGTPDQTNCANSVVNFSCSFPLMTNGVNNLSNAPAFADPVTDWHLQAASPCINAGNDSYVTGNADVEGNNRIVGPTVDLGAYEYQLPTIAITTQPTNQVWLRGQAAQFNVAAVSPFPLGYQWFFNGAPLAEAGNIAGSTSANLAITDLQFTNSGNYYVVVTNAFGSATSAVAALTVHVPPFIVAEPQSQTVTAGDNGFFNVTVDGNPVLQCQWYYNGIAINGSPYAGYATTNLAILPVQTANAGSYHAVIHNLYGSVTSAVAVLTVVVRPQFDVPPQSHPVALGTNLDLSAVVSGTLPISCQWYFNGAPLADGARITGAYSNRLTITGAQPADAGNYWLAATNVGGGGISPTATINVLAPPVITLQPADQTLPQGSTNTFNAAASGDAPLSYQWYFNGTPLADGARVSGATTTNLTITDLHFADGGSYTLVATNPVGSATSAAAVLTVVSPPEITQQPSDQNVLFGSDAVFSATIIGTPPISYQWFFNGSSVGDDLRISGSTTDSLAIGNAGTNDAGSYFIVATNAYGAVTSSVANLAVWFPMSITQQPSNIVAAIGSTFGLTIAADGTGPAGYRWYFNNSPMGDGGRISGSSTAALVVSNAQPSDIGNYFVVVTNLLSSATSTVASVSVLTPPSIVTQPIGRSTPLGVTNIFAAAGTGSAPLLRQWRLNGVDIPGATNTTYFIAAVGTNDLGVYQFVVSNAVGFAVSSNALLTAGPIAAWGNNLALQCLPPPGLSNVTTFAGGPDYSVASLLDGRIVAWGGKPATNSTWTNIVAVSAGVNGALVLRSDGVLLGSSGVDPALFNIKGSNIIAIAAGYQHGLALRAEGTVVGWGGQAGPTPAGAVPAGLAKVVAIAAGTYHSMALRSDGTVVAWGGGAATNVPIGLTNVVAIAAGASNSLALKNDGAVVAWGAGPSVTVISNGLNNITAIAAGGYSDGRTSIGMALRTNGTVTAWGASSYSQTNVLTGLSNVVGIADGTYHCLALVNDGTPQILRPPVGGVAWAGRDLILRSAAAGAAPLSYHWSCNGTNIAGATNATLLLPAVQTGNAGSYQFVVSNALGVAAALPVPVSVVSDLPFLLSRPATNISAYLGTRLALSVAVGGSGPLQYQWQFNSNNIPGATNDALVFDRIHLTNAGNYSVTVSNVFGGVAAPVIKVTVQQLVLWGDNIDSATNMPANMTNVAAISANYNGNIALRDNGTITIWGSQTYVPTNTAIGISNVIEVSAGNNSFLVLRSNGRPYIWGNVTATISNAVVSQSNIIAVAAGNNAYSLLKNNGSVVWVSFSGTTILWTNVISVEPFDDGAIGLCANGTVTSINGGFSPPSTLTNVLAIASGRYQGIAAKRDGRIQDWASSLLPGVSNVVTVAAAPGQTPEFVVRADGTVLSSVSTISSTSTTNVPYGLSSVVRLDSGNNHCLALLADREFPAIPLHTALNTSNYVVSSKGAPQWFGQAAINHDGTNAAQSAPIGNNLASSMRMWVLGPTTVKFWWKVSSETNHDFLSFVAGAVTLTNVSGETDWRQVTVDVPSGKQILQWIYTKDNNGSSGQDAGWVDQLQVVPTPPMITVQPQPAVLDVPGGTYVTYTVSATGTPPLTYVWKKDGGTVLSGINLNLLSLQNVTRSNSGTYNVQVTSPYGNVTSSNAVLKVHVPQLLGAPVLQPDGSLSLTSTDADGGVPTSADLANLQVQVTTNLVDWTTLPGALVLTNNTVRIQDPEATNAVVRFYRIIETW